MARETRRDLLRWLAGAGSLGLAGCQGDSKSDRSPSPTGGPVESTTSDERANDTDGGTSPESANDEEIERAIDLDFSFTESESSILLHLTGRIASPDGIAAINLDTTEDDARIVPDDATEHAVDATLAVGGGQAYEITVSVNESDGDRFEDTLETGYVPRFVGDIPQPDRLVGTHYYPWYEMHGGHQNWTAKCVADPVLGEYAADDPAVIDQHLAWCLEHGIRWLSVSWWGPWSGTDRALRNDILDAERFGDIEFSILYETRGRLEEFNFDLDDSLAQERLTEDLLYLEEQYFAEDNYLHLDGRPVIYVYIANALRGDLPAAFREVYDALETAPYLLADISFQLPASSFPITQVADAVTDYNPYTARPDIEEIFHECYAIGNKILHLGSDAAEVGYVPVVIPGYNDTGIPDSQREDNPVLEATPDRFARVIEQAGPHLGDAEAVLITSFNEWYENTQIEPYEAYGTEYLEITRDRLATEEYRGYQADGTRLRLDFNKTVVPAEVNPDSTDERRLAFAADAIRFVDGGEEIAAFDIGGPGDEPLFIEGVFGPGSNADESWRWLGGYTEEATLLVEDDVAGADELVLRGLPMVSDEISAAIHFGGREVEHLEFGKRDGFDDYHIGLS
jgi:hypothetical protein